MALEIIKTPLEDLLIIKTRVFTDERGYFTELYNENAWAQHGVKDKFVQHNQSCSKKGVLRGLHFQYPPHQQGKLVQVIKGKILDVAVDLRVSSPTYGQHYSLELSEENMLQLLIPGSFAHGFLALEDDTIVQYSNTNYYAPGYEGGLQWNDPDLAIDWGTDKPILSEKDKKNILFTNFESPFNK